jgi:hypothetical protein
MPADAVAVHGHTAEWRWLKGERARRCVIDRDWRVPLVNDASTAGILVLPAVGSKVIARDGSVCWVVAEQPLSRFAEAIRSVKLAADLNIPSTVPPRPFIREGGQQAPFCFSGAPL